MAHETTTLELSPLSGSLFLVNLSSNWFLSVGPPAKTVMCSCDFQKILEETPTVGF